MSTFDGNIREFPDIQVDYFRTPSNGCRPLACFLSHVHSDHLVGLEGLRSPFVYCSAATKALLLKLERYPCRVNFARGILEARQRTYKDLKHLLKPLPLNTPTGIELSPGNHIQVTLLDANHCPGSVMFLFENDTQAVLYTGDTRCEPWFVNALVRSPCLAEYAAGLRVLDTVYLDTTCIRKDVHFQTKAEGLRDLLQQVARYPADTVFHFRAWTFGYEDVWLALAKALRSQVHVDQYKMDLYQSLRCCTAQVPSFSGSSGPSGSLGRLFSASASPGAAVSVTHLVPEAPGLVGFMCGNAIHDGCLTTGDDDDDGIDGCHGKGVRLHSCDKSAGYCEAVRDRPVVWIYPVVCRLPHGQGDVAEVGAGGGGEDLTREAEVEAIDTIEPRKRRSPSIKDEIGGTTHSPLLQNEGLHSEKLKVEAEQKVQLYGLDSSSREREPTKQPLPQSIAFPYSRHSSYAELCHLLSELRPRDVWPCTVREEEWFNSGHIVTIRALFGEFCSGNVFRHDEEVAAKMRHCGLRVEVADSQATTDSDVYSAMADVPKLDWARYEAEEEEEGGGAYQEKADSQHTIDDRQEDDRCELAPYVDSGLPFFYPTPSSGTRDDHYRRYGHHDDPCQDDSQASALSDFSRDMRMQSHAAIIQNAVGGGDWIHIGLASTADNHSMPDVDLGYGRRADGR